MCRWVLACLVGYVDDWTDTCLYIRIINLIHVRKCLLSILSTALHVSLHNTSSDVMQAAPMVHNNSGPEDLTSSCYHSDSAHMMSSNRKIFHSPRHSSKVMKEMIVDNAINEEAMQSMRWWDGSREELLGNAINKAMQSMTQCNAPDPTKCSLVMRCNAM
jgi:hypothetical protein